MDELDYEEVSQLLDVWYAACPTHQRCHGNQFSTHPPIVLDSVHVVALLSDDCVHLHDYYCFVFQCGCFREWLAVMLDVMFYCICVIS